MSMIEQLTDYTSPDTSLPILYRDRIINASSLFCFDFVDPYCNPLADGPIANGAQFLNLVDGGLPATVSGTGFSNLAGKAGISSPGGGNASQILFGNAGSYDLEPLTPDPRFCIALWIKTPNSGFTSAAYSRLFSLTTGNANVSQWWMDLGSNGITPRGLNGNAGGTGSAGPQGVSGAGQGSRSQVLVDFNVPAGVGSVYVNGALSGTANQALAGGTSLRSAAAATVRFFALYAGTLYRCWGENLTASGNSPAERALTDWDLNSSRFT